MGFMIKKLKSGFTVVELVVVIVVIAILVSLTVIGYGVMRDRTYDETVTTDLKSIASAMDAFKSVKGEYPGRSVNIQNMGNDTPEARFSVSKESYDVESSKVTANGLVENLFICSIAQSRYAAAAVSKSGHVLTIESSDPGTVNIDKYAWTTDIKDMCKRVLVLSSASGLGYDGRAYYSRDASSTDLSSGWGNWRWGGMDQLQPY